MEIKEIVVVTTGRCDYGIYLPLLRKIQEDPDLQLSLIVTGMHLSSEFGSMIKVIEQDGFEIREQIEMLLSSDSPGSIAKSMGLGIIGFAQSFVRARPDILIVLGDRFEMFAAALAALPFKIPVAHIHGGELTEGAIDDALRHSITKLSHLHFVSTREYALRVLQLGEEVWRVVIAGALSLDNLDDFKLLTLRELEAKYELKLDSAPLLVTFHPVSLEYERAEWQVGELLAALEQFNIPIVFTTPNADTNRQIIKSSIDNFIRSHRQAYMVNHFGTQDYFSMMACARAMIGNSSSGIIEAQSLRLPVVNIGTRERGRIRGQNVLDASYGRAAISKQISTAISTEFRNAIKDIPNPYSGGGAAEIIVRSLKRFESYHRLIVKSFVDWKKH